MLDAQRTLSSPPADGEAIAGAFEPRRPGLDVDFAARVVDLPDAFELDRLQSVGADQRLKSLAGNEWLGFSGFGTDPAFHTAQLPGLSAYARCYRHERFDELSLDLESVQIHADNSVCSLLWRGQTALDSETDLSLVQVLGGIAHRCDALPWFDPFERAEPEAFRGTLAVQSAGFSAAAMPFLKSKKPSTSHNAAPSVTKEAQDDGALLSGGTVDWSALQADMQVGAVAATPFATSRKLNSAAKAKDADFSENDSGSVQAEAASGRSQGAAALIGGATVDWTALQGENTSSEPFALAQPRGAEQKQSEGVGAATAEKHASSSISRPVASALPFAPMDVAIGHKPSKEQAAAEGVAAQFRRGITVDGPSPVTPELMAELGIRMPTAKKRPSASDSLGQGPAAASESRSGSSPEGLTVSAKNGGPRAEGPSNAIGGSNLGGGLLQTLDLGPQENTADLAKQQSGSSGARPSLPFQQGRVDLPVSEVSLGAIGIMPGFGSTLDLSPRQAYDAATATTATPFDTVDEDGNRVSLGQHFLAAMSALGAR